MSSGKQKRAIPGTTLFDGDMARKGLCAEQDVLFLQLGGQPRRIQGRGAYCDKWGLNAQQKAAVLSLQVLDMLAAGGNAYYLAKLGGIYGLDMQDIGAQQTGVTKDEFKAKLVAAGRK
jgi:protocatechuate 4,5-dioxygenase alpha chain